MRISGQEVKNLRFSSTDNDFDDRINYQIKEIWMNGNYMEVFFFPGKGPSRSSAEMEKSEYRVKGEWITRAGRILSWNELYDYLKIFSVEESIMKTFEQFTINEAVKFDNVDDFIDDLANNKNSAIDMWLSPNKKDRLFSLYKSGKKITIWKGGPNKLDAKIKEMESKGFTLYAYENNYGQVEAVFYK